MQGCANSAQGQREGPPAMLQRCYATPGACSRSAFPICNDRPPRSPGARAHTTCHRQRNRSE
eukprot:14770388-Alexandrium_andersonii.AAC.1